MAEWFSIEVFDGDGSARLWSEIHADPIIWAAQHCGATDWDITEHSWGVLLELELPDEERFELLRAEIAYALDAVPDPIGGLLVHRGRGGSAGSRLVRGPRPVRGAGAMALPIPA